MRAAAPDRLEEDLAVRARRVSALLRRAGEGGLILFLTYNYEKSRQRVETSLVAQLAAGTLQPVPLDLAEERFRDRDLVSMLLELDKPGKTVLMARGIGRLGEAALRSLNYQRERLVEGRVKVVFWLTGQELRSIATLAPDFWALKHRIIDFPEAAGDEGLRDIYQAATAFISRTHFESSAELAGMIATREAILEGMPATNTAERRDVLVTLGELYYDSGRYADAEASLREALKLARRRKAAVLEARISHNLGVLTQVQGRLEEALDYHSRSLEIEARLGDQRGVSGTLHQLGTLAQGQGRLEEALDHYTRSLEIAERLGNQRGIAATLHQLGTLAQGQGRLAEAQDYYDSSLEMEERLGDQWGIAATLHALGMLVQDQGRLAEAQDYYARSLEIKERLGDQRGIASTLHQLGVLAQDQGRLEEALDYYTRSLEIEERLGNQGGIAITLHNLGRLAQDQGRLAEAANKFQRAVDTFARLGSPDVETARRSYQRVQQLIAEQE